MYKFVVRKQNHPLGQYEAMITAEDGLVLEEAIGETPAEAKANLEKYLFDLLKYKQRQYTQMLNTVVVGKP
jgi:hypothetical protein